MFARHGCAWPRIAKSFAMFTGQSLIRKIFPNLVCLFTVLYFCWKRVNWDGLVSKSCSFFSILHIFMLYICEWTKSWCWMPWMLCVFFFFANLCFSISFLSWERVKLGGWWLPVFPNDNNAEDNGRTMRHVKLHQLFWTFPGEFDIMCLFDYKDCCCLCFKLRAQWSHSKEPLPEIRVLFRATFVFRPLFS